MNASKRITLCLLIFLPVFTSGVLSQYTLLSSLICSGIGVFFILCVVLEYPLKSNGKIKNNFETFEIGNRKYIKNCYQIVLNDNLHQLEPITPVSLYSAQTAETKITNLLNIPRQDYEANLICNHDGILYEEQFDYDTYRIVIFKDLEKAKVVCELLETQIVTNKIME